MLGTVISVIALVVALASAAFAQESSDTAKRANEISLHEKRLNLLKRLEVHRLNLIVNGGWLLDMDYASFAGDLGLCEFYYPSDLFKKTYEIQKELGQRWISQMIKKNKPTFENNEVEAQELHDWAIAIGRKLEADCFEDMKKLIRISQ